MIAWSIGLTVFALGTISSVCFCCQTGRQTRIERFNGKCPLGLGHVKVDDSNVQWRNGEKFQNSYRRIQTSNKNEMSMLVFQVSFNQHVKSWICAICCLVSRVLTLGTLLNATGGIAQSGDSNRTCFQAFFPDHSSCVIASSMLHGINRTSRWSKKSHNKLCLVVFQLHTFFLVLR
jgi:hypothetical protein